MNIVFTAQISQEQEEKLVQSFPTASFIFHASAAEAKDDFPKADIIVTYGNDITETIIEEAVHLKWIMVISAGIDDMPLKLIQEKGIALTNAQGIHKVPMSEYVISMLLQFYRHEKQLIEQEKASDWNRSFKLETREISGRTMLILGTGAIGQEVARVAKAFRMKTYGVSRSGISRPHFDKVVTLTSVDELLKEADFVISVLPSTPETRGIFTKAFFEKMNQNAVFLNMGRGDAVVGDDLIAALDQNELAHAILDVFPEEPLSEASPFWQHEKVTVTPHTSGVSEYYLPRALDIFSDNLTLFLAGKQPEINAIDFARGY